MSTIDRLSAIWRDLITEPVWRYDELPPFLLSQLTEQDLLEANQSELARVIWFWLRRPKFRFPESAAVPGASRVRGIPSAVFNLGAMMKMQMLGVLVIGSLLTSSTLGDDLPKMGYTPAISVNELVAKGYRWVTVNGPYACVTEQELRQVTGGHTDLTELHMVEDGDAYYLIPGMLVRVVRDDQVNGMAEIRLGGITSPRWTYTRFLSARPIRDIYGVIETPDIAGLVDTSDAAGKELRSEGPTTASQIVMSPRTLQQGIKIGERNAKQVAGQ